MSIHSDHTTPADATAPRAYLNAPHFSDGDDLTGKFRVAYVVSGGRLQVWRYRRTGVSVQGVDYFGWAADCLAAFALTKKGDISMRRTSVGDDVYSLAFQALPIWQSAGCPSEWVYQEFGDWVSLKAGAFLREKEVAR